jgi:hypothetical protein
VNFLKIQLEKPYENSSASTSELAIAAVEVADAAQSDYKESWIKLNTTPLAGGTRCP